MNSHIQNIIIKAHDRASSVFNRIERTLGSVSRSTFSLKAKFRSLNSAMVIKARDKASAVLKRIGRKLAGVTRSVFSLKAAFIGLGTVMTLKGVLNKSMGAFNKMQSAMIGLSSVATKMGESARTAMGYMTVDADSAKQAAQELSADGLMSIDDAATGLKNLLLSGFGLNQAVDMLNAFKDSAAFGRQSALSFGEAIRSAAEGVKNENSILVDNAGITKNLSVMHKEHAATLGKTVGKLTEVEKRTAVYNGVIKESLAMQGDAARVTDTYQGAVSKLDNSMFLLWAQIGDALAPTLKAFIDDSLIPAVEGVKSWVEANKELIGQNLEYVLDAVGRAFQWIATQLEADESGVSNFSAAVADMWEVTKPIYDQVVESLVQIRNYFAEDSAGVSLFKRDVASFKGEWARLTTQIDSATAALKSFLSMSRSAGDAIGSLSPPSDLSSAGQMILGAPLSFAYRQLTGGSAAKDSGTTMNDVTIIQSGQPQGALP